MCLGEGSQLQFGEQWCSGGCGDGYCRNHPWLSLRALSIWTRQIFCSTSLNPQPNHTKHLHILSPFSFYLHSKKFNRNRIGLSEWRDFKCQPTTRTWLRRGRSLKKVCPRIIWFDATFDPSFTETSTSTPWPLVAPRVPGVDHIMTRYRHSLSICSTQGISLMLPCSFLGRLKDGVSHQKYMALYTVAYNYCTSSRMHGALDQAQLGGRSKSQCFILAI